MSGGIAFATPDKEMGKRVKDGAAFALSESAEKDWLNWAPRISIHPAKSNLAQEPTPPRAGGLDAGPLKNQKD
jgi:hypothetical protein